MNNQMNHKEKQAEKKTQVVDNTIEDSFPASDPPSWTGSVVEKGHKEDA